MEEKEYYSAKDIAKKLDCCLSTAYEKIEDLNQLLIQKYPNIVIFEKKIPIWFMNVLNQLQIIRRNYAKIKY